MEEQKLKSRKDDILGRSKNIIYYIFGVLEVLLAFRLLFKLLGANPQSGFVTFVYSLTSIFVVPFSGIFRTAVSQGLSAQAVFEPATIMAMIVYGILAWGIAKLIEVIWVNN